ncbi:ATP-binding protein [Paractinoplanes toevensis]|uniref:Histidine kinase/HSP90-like ATPase domain-containing protein n=1 Tax=Paractinoplanes toevensis TaxID=571911 RepID=A0A919WBY8_9ACTN|nr:ATP-binding protein [Actinoplanes toevensis]GIM97361.1 hypothetical protein Ato02nite_091540 [Actinoplanes toevensis]
MSSLRLLAPPAHARQLLSWDLTSSDDLRRIRAGLHRHVGAGLPGDRAGPDDVADRMALVVTELAGNALRHGRPPYVVTLLRDADCYILDVSDHSPDKPPDLPRPQEQIRVGGRGLVIARTLAREVCWYPAGPAKHIWASFPAPSPPPDVVPLC